MENLCKNARDVMLAQITQLFGEEDDTTVEDRTAMAEYLQGCLQDYMARKCKPPELGEPFPPLNEEEAEAEGASATATPAKESSKDTALPAPSTELPSIATAVISNGSNIPAKGNIVIRRVLDEPSKSAETNQPASSSSTSTLSGPPKHQRALQQAFNPLRSNNITKLFEREHAPGIRQAGCPCCYPDNPSTFADKMMML
jgi:hypothetical protein